MALPYKEVMGQDFGTASPAATTGAKIFRNNLYVRQINYKPKTVLDLAKMYCQMQLGPQDEIIADSAEPKSIMKLKSGYRGHELSVEEFEKYPALSRGFNIKPARKGADSISAGIDLLLSMNIYICEEAVDIWHEVNHWVYAMDKNGNATDEPVDDFNHAIDTLRYILQAKRGLGNAFQAVEEKTNYRSR
jgi:phage terminase large subunit